MKRVFSTAATNSVHAGTQIDKTTGGVNTPIHTSSSFGYINASKNIYPRYNNTPNQLAVVAKLVALEGAEDGLLFSSGMSAIGTTLLSFLQKGDHLVLSKEIYGGTYKFIVSQLNRLGIEYTFTSSTDVESFEQAVQKNTKLIFIESPSNPLLRLTDIEGVVKLAKKYDVITAIDSTFASPINQNPIELGVDLVIHSGTKFLGGHSDLAFGAVVGSKSHIAQLYDSTVDFGGIINAQTCALIERSMKTLALRVERQTENAQVLANFLESHPDVLCVNYPGLASHPHHQLARKQMKGFGAMLSFEFKDNVDVDNFLDRLEIIMPALSLGGVETLICVSAKTSHLTMTPQERKDAGVSDGLLRLSVGIEGVDDLIVDIEKALK